MTTHNRSKAERLNYATTDHPASRVRAAMTLAGKRGRIGLKFTHLDECEALQEAIKDIPGAAARVYPVYAGRD